MDDTTQLNVGISASVVDELRTLSSEVGAPLKDLVGVLLKYALSKADREGLKTWAKSLPARQGRGPRTGYKAGELACLAHLEALSLSADPANAGTVHPHTAIARAGGLLLRTAYDSLASLRMRGQVRGVCSPDLDRWGRPVESVWWLPSRERQGVDQEAVFAAVRAIRDDAARTSFDATGLALMQRAIRNSSGWSVAAQALPDAVASESEAQVVGLAYREWLKARWPLPLS